MKEVSYGIIHQPKFEEPIEVKSGREKRRERRQKQRKIKNPKY
jgi:hypothetical protein